MRSSTVKKQARNEDGELEGTHHAHPIMDTWTYPVEFDDGQMAEYSANLIAENMVAMCDQDGNQF